MRLQYQDFLTRLAQGQLKNTSAVSDPTSGCIEPEYEEMIRNLTNQGLVDISSRKKLFEDTATLTLVEGTNVYALNTNEGGPFFGLVSVYEIIASDGKTYTPKTNIHILQPNAETLRFSDTFLKYVNNLPEIDCIDGPDKGMVDVRFQVLHPQIVEMDNDEITLPSHLVESLLLYVAGLYMSQMGGEEHTAKGDRYYGLYLSQMTEDTLANTSGTSEVTELDNRFCDRGFV